jgi:hypothetical protein
MACEEATMDIAAYASSITFHTLQPADEAGNEVLALGDLSPIEAVRRMRSAADFELSNTELPDDATAERLADLLMVPRMSTLAVAAILNHAVGALAPGTSYVNVGVWQGFTFLAGGAGHDDTTCIGIDDFSELGGPRSQFLKRLAKHGGANHHFFELDYREYFAREHQGPIGLYLYDGAHGYDDQLEGLRAAEPFLAEECTVVVDDTNLPEPRQATLDFVANSDRAWHVVFDVKTRHTMHPTFWNGVMVLRSAPLGLSPRT